MMKINKMLKNLMKVSLIALGFGASLQHSGASNLNRVGPMSRTVVPGSNDIRNTDSEVGKFYNEYLDPNSEMVQEFNDSVGLLENYLRDLGSTPSANTDNDDEHDSPAVLSGHGISNLSSTMAFICSLNVYLDSVGSFDFLSPYTLVTMRADAQFLREKLSATCCSLQYAQGYSDEIRPVLNAFRFIEVKYLTPILYFLCGERTKASDECSANGSPADYNRNRSTDSNALRDRMNEIRDGEELPDWDALYELAKQRYAQ